MLTTTEKIDKLKEKIVQIYGNQADGIIRNLTKDTVNSFRINKLRIEEETCLRQLRVEGFSIKEGPVGDSYLSEVGPKRLSESRAFTDGLIYIQELSSMLPVLELAPKESETILDIAAAPGSKTSQIAQLTFGKASIVAVERSKDRFFALKRNLEHQGIGNVQTIFANGVGLDKRFPNFINFFDKVLVDAPCTNEGLIKSFDPKSYKFWNPKKYRDLSRLQKGLIISGARMLKPGGSLVYSTCTFSVEENEEVIDWLLKKLTELKVVELNLNIPNMMAGVTLYKNQNYVKDISKTARIISNEYFEPFFLAKLTKIA